MMKKNRLTVILVVLFLAVSLFAGCNQDEPITVRREDEDFPASGARTENIDISREEPPVASSPNDGERDVDAEQDSSEQEDSSTEASEESSESLEPTAPSGSSPGAGEAAEGTYAIVQMVGQDSFYGKKEYRSSQQIDRLLSFLPGEGDLADPSMYEKINEIILQGAVPVDLDIVYDGRRYHYYIYSQGYAVTADESGANIWYTIDQGVWYLLASLSDWNPSVLGGNIQYNGQTVTGLYSFESGSYSYHWVNSQAKVAEVIGKIEEKQPDPLVDSGELGFLIFCGSQKFTYYFNESTDAELTALANECNGNYPNLVQWLASMSPDEITSIQFEGNVGSSYSLASYPEALHVSVNATSRDSINRVSHYLKNIVVGKDIKAYENLNGSSQPTLYTMEISFSSGLSYRLFGYKDGLIISSPEMNIVVQYSCSEMQINILRDLMSVLPEAVLSSAG